MLSEQTKEIIKKKIWIAIKFGYKFTDISNTKYVKENDYLILFSNNLICTKLEAILFGEICVGNFQKDLCNILSISVDEIKEVESYCKLICL